MIIRTEKTKQSKVYRHKQDSQKQAALYRVTTYWFLFIPLYINYKIIE